MNDILYMLQIESRNKKNLTINCSLNEETKKRKNGWKNIDNKPNYKNKDATDNNNNNTINANNYGNKCNEFGKTASTRINCSQNALEGGIEDRRKLRLSLTNSLPFFPHRYTIILKIL